MQNDVWLIHIVILRSTTRTFSTGIFTTVVYKKGEDDDRSCYENLMEDINNFKTLNQNENNPLCYTRFGWNQQLPQIHLSNQQEKIVIKFLVIL